MTYRRRKRTGGKKRRLFIILILLVLILVYIFLFSPLFKIRAIEVSGNRDIRIEEIRNNFSYKNIFLFTENKIRNDLIKKIPKISELEVKKNLIKRTVKLILKEREMMGIICQVSEQETRNPKSYDGADKKQEEIKNCFYIDKQGIIFEDAPQTSGSLILLIKDYSQRDFKLGEKVFKEGIIDFILEAREGLSEIGLKTLDFDILSFPPKELKVITSEGWYLLFDLERDIKSQLLALKVALEEKIQERENLEYVDLRIENRIYYK